MTGRLAGKHAVVTAAGQGIGRATVEAYRAEGATVLAVDIDPSALASLEQGCGCDTAQCDLTDAAALAALCATIKQVDVLCSFAGVVASGSILDCDDTSWEQSLTLNVTSSMRLIRGTLPAMIAGGGGAIIVMSSVASSLKGVANRFAYGTTKAALNGMVKALAADFVSQNIRANAICPGTVETPSLEQRLSATGNYDTAHAAFIARQPMGRFGRASEIAALAAYLGSDEAAFVTGQTIAIDGGWTI